jgi:hypothetical protein
MVTCTNANLQHELSRTLTNYSAMLQLNGLFPLTKYDFEELFLRNNANPMLQPIQALEHRTFKKMIDIAARATNGVTVPSRKVTRQEIIDMFKTQMTNLKERLNVVSIWLIIIRETDRSFAE